MRSQTYLLVAATLMLSAVALPSPASALRCTPIDADELVNEVRCQAGAIECNSPGEPVGDAVAAACAEAAGTLDGALALGAAAEATLRERAERTVGGLDDIVIHPGALDHILP